MNLRLLVNDLMGVLLPEVLVFGLRERNVLLSFKSRRLAHKVLESGRREDGDQVNGVGSDIRRRNPDAGWNEYRGAGMDESGRLAQMYVGTSVAQQSNSRPPNREEAEHVRLSMPVVIMP